jgi:hypothetical protein
LCRPNVLETPEQWQADFFAFRDAFVSAPISGTTKVHTHTHTHAHTHTYLIAFRDAIVSAPLSLRLFPGHQGTLIFPFFFINNLPQGISTLYPSFFACLFFLVISPLGTELSRENTHQSCRFGLFFFSSFSFPFQVEINKEKTLMPQSCHI